MFSTIIAFSAVALSQAAAVKCPVMGGPIVANSPSIEYQSALYKFCCKSCDKLFARSPAKYIQAQSKAGNVVGVFLFDPVSRNRVALSKAKATSVFGGLRYPFESPANRKLFDRNPKKYAAVPAKEALYCPVGAEAVPTHSAASDYVDHDGVRWYMCCAGCGGPFAKNPAKYTANTSQYIRKTVALRENSRTGPNLSQSEVISKVRFGKNEAELRIPEEGIFAQEEMDIEFRVVDTTQKDPVEAGFKGVGAIEATAVVTMPSMAGMPEAKPAVHREGVPGDYGIELFFPHGGDYRISLALNIPGVGAKNIAFVVDVKDERPAGLTRVQPYQLKVVEWPTHVMAGTPVDLKLQVYDTKAKKAQTAFDEAHERDFHLLLASKDLNWFLHEHPVMAADGTWSIPITFPAGGEYWVYGDVAPSGKGSRVLITKVSVMGPKPTWDTRLTLTTKAEDRGLKAELSSLEPIQVGKRTTLQVKLVDAATGKPAGDTVPWLGAAGHMMIFIEDGQTVVHSHPADDPENAELVKKGVVRFSGRFPKAGLYKVYSQFDWHGEIHTLGFVIRVK